MKTARFKDVVARCGQPEIHLTWSAPSSDRELQAAERKHRVLTVFQQTRGAKKDYGVVGLEIAAHTQYLVFPKSLQSFGDQRIVGIRYDLINEHLSSGGKLPATRIQPKRPSKNASDKIVPFEPSPPAPKPFKKVVVQKVQIPEPEETDPNRREVRHAIEDLKAGHAQKARKRLEGLLRQKPEV